MAIFNCYVSSPEGKQNEQLSVADQRSQAVLVQLFVLRLRQPLQLRT